MPTARQLIEDSAGSSTTDDLTTLAYAINYNFSFDYRLTPDHVEAMWQNPEVLLTPTAKRQVNPLIVGMMLSSASAGKQEWISQIKDLVTVDVLLHQYKVYSLTGAFGIDRKRRVIDTASKFGFGPYLDQKAYRIAMATVLRKEESLPDPVNEATDKTEARQSMLAELYTRASTVRRLTSAQVAAVKADPRLLTDVAGTGMSALSAAVHFARVLGSSAALTSMLATGALTPELLFTPAYTSNFDSPPTHLEFIQGRKAEGLLDPTVYRKALAMKLRKEESLPDPSGVLSDPNDSAHTRDEKIGELCTHIRSNRPFNAEQIEWMRKDPSILTDWRYRPCSLIELAALYADPADHSLLAPENNLALKQMSDLNLITPEMLVQPSGFHKDTSILRRVEVYGAVQHLDPGVYRKALAAQLKQP